MASMAATLRARCASGIHVGPAGRQLDGGVDLLEHDRPVADGGPDGCGGAPLERTGRVEPTPVPVDRQWRVAARHGAIIRARAPRDKRAALGLRRPKASRRSPRAPKVAGMTQRIWLPLRPGHENLAGRLHGGRGREGIRLMTTAFRVSRIAEADDGSPDGQRSTRTRLMARFLDTSTLDIRSRRSCSPSPRSDAPSTSFPARSGSSSASPQRRGQGREAGAA